MPDHSLLLWIIGALLTVTGLAGLLLPVIPGAPLLFLGLLCGAWAEKFQYVGFWTLLLLAGMTILTYVVEFGASALGVRKYGGSRRAMAGAALGGIVGIFGGIPGILYYYERNQKTEMSVIQEVHALDPDDVEKVWLLYHNPECSVVGPNDFFGNRRKVESDAA